MATSFQNDIAPIFAPFVAQMMWRLDLSNYENVKANAATIQQLITASADNGRMPPAPYPGLRQEDIDTYNQWMTEQCPP